MRAAALTVAGLIVSVGAAFLAFLTLPDRPQIADYQPVSFDELPGWGAGKIAGAVPALKRSCKRIISAKPEAPMGADALFGSIRDWRTICRNFLGLLKKRPDPGRLRAFFEDRFRPFAVKVEGRSEGLFTGYFEPEYPGSLTRSETYNVPIYSRPENLVTADLGLFRAHWEGERIAGTVENGRMKPFPTRGEIETGPLLDNAEPIAWLKSPVDAFFLHIQGSGVIRLPNGDHMRLGYAGQNGRAYTSIGRVLAAKGAIEPDAVSMQTIRTWLENHKSAAARIMRKNESYIFFRRVEGDAPVGSEGVPLTPGRSLAVDRAVIPLGVPIWLDTEAPRADGDGQRPVQRLMVAQDTGSAIKGPVRGDVFWGTGADAGAIAGRMQSRGRYYVLVLAAASADGG